MFRRHHTQRTLPLNVSSSKPLTHWSDGSASLRKGEEEPLYRPKALESPRDLKNGPSSGVITPDALDFHRYI